MPSFSGKKTDCKLPHLVSFGQALHSCSVSYSRLHLLTSVGVDVVKSERKDKRDIIQILEWFKHEYGDCEHL